MVLKIRQISPTDQAWVEHTIRAEWGSDIVVVRGQVFYPARLAGLIAEQGDSPVGLLTYIVKENVCEIITLNALNLYMGIGTALLNDLVRIAKVRSCKKLIVVTTNDNLTALRFYQRRDFRLVAIHRNAVDEARKIKPVIPEIGLYQIPIHDELELERDL
ncbi:MAG: GNAT family N-acetyltransferase [Candidatus Thorarchaeota archaeon]